MINDLKTEHDLLREAAELLRIAYDAHQKMGLEGQGNRGLPHEVRTFAAHFSEPETPQSAEHVILSGDGRFQKWWDAYKALRHGATCGRGDSMTDFKPGDVVRSKDGSLTATRVVERVEQVPIREWQYSPRRLVTVGYETVLWMRDSYGHLGAISSKYCELVTTHQQS